MKDAKKVTTGVNNESYDFDLATDHPEGVSDLVVTDTLLRFTQINWGCYDFNS